MENYAEFAQVYDLFMDNIDYDSWSRWLTGKLRELGIADGILCELGCGTGTMTELLAGAGYDMIGIDASPEMLEIASEKKLESGHDILYLMQDARSFELYGTVRAVVSVCDSLNYVTEPEELLQVFRLVNNYLDPGGYFLFDLNTPARYRAIGEATIAENRDEGSFIWENQYDPETQINEYLLTLFLPEHPDLNRDTGCTGEQEESNRTCGASPIQGNLYRKYEEFHVQRAYAISEVQELIRAAGMELIGAWEAYTDNAPEPETERILYLARERGKG